MKSKSTKTPTVLRPERGRKPRRKPSALRPGPVRDEPYKAWVRLRPCLLCCLNHDFQICKDFMRDAAFLQHYDGTRWACEQGSLTESAHMGPHGISQKAGDDTCVPLCAEHHREGKDSAHKLGKKFAEHHGLDIPAIQAKLRAQYAAERTK